MRLDFYKRKRVNLATDPLLTNPLNSSTKLQIRVTFQNKFLLLCINSMSGIKQNRGEKLSLTLLIIARYTAN